LLIGLAADSGLPGVWGFFDDPGARERAFWEKRRLRAAELFEQGVPNVLVADQLGVADSAVDL
jgi:hypothetical protein